jgi:hypothetical protein
MGAQRCFKHAREMGVGCGWTKIKREFKSKGGQVYGFWIASVIDHIESRACRN